MKAIRFHGYGGTEVLGYEDADDPTPASGEVVVLVHATSLNPIDWKLRRGDMKNRMPLTFPATVGSDVAGVVSGTHERVMGLVQHAYAEKVAVPRSALAAIPEGMSDETAAALPLVVTTGAQLIEVGVKPARGITVLVSGALGGVGRTAVFVAKQHGARVIAGVRRSQKAEAATLGADQVVAIDDDADLAGIHHIDAVADCVGGPTAEKLVACVRPGGVFASVVGGAPGVEDRGIHAENVYATPDAKRLEELARDVQRGALVIPVHRVFRFSEIKEATALAEKGGVGKIILKP